MMKKSTASRKVEWLQIPGSHCNRYRAWGIRPLCRCWRGWRWVGGEQTCFRRLLIAFYNPWTVTTVYSMLVFDIAIESRSLFTCAHATWILAMPSIREQRLIERHLIEWIQYTSPSHGLWGICITSCRARYPYVYVEPDHVLARVYMLRTDCKPNRFINGPPVYKPVSRFVIRLACFW